MIDKTKFDEFSEKYLAALQIHLKNGDEAGLQVAGRLGEQAVTLGLETLDLAKIHERAFGTLRRNECAASFPEETTNKAAIFFGGALAPIEETHRLARDADAELSTLTASLVERTEEVEAAEKKLQQGVTRRKAAESTFALDNVESLKLLEESRHLQEQLQEMAHLILTAQEDERKTMSLSLQNDIAQTLLGLQVRLLALKNDAALHNEDFKKEIAIAESLVEKSMKTINDFARELGLPNAS